MESLFDPERLRQREGVCFHEETHAVDAAEFEGLQEDLDDHVVVGVTNDDGEVLLMDDGAHGWTVTAFPVAANEDWMAIGRRGIEDLTGTDIGIAGPERVRRIEFYVEGDREQQARMYNVVFRSSRVAGRPIASDPTVRGDAIEDLGWFNEVPAGQDGDVAEDVRLFLD